MLLELLLPRYLRNMVNIETKYNHHLFDFFSLLILYMHFLCNTLIVLSVSSGYILVDVYIYNSL